MIENPVLVEVTRGEMVESWHRGAVAVVHGDGQTAVTMGDTRRMIYPRSAIKPLQAVFVVESGAADEFGLTDRELALACASHNGEPGHVDAVRNWLAQLGFDEQVLECGTHPPRRSKDTTLLIESGLSPGPAHNNCSGKHCGFLSSAKFLGESAAGYIKKSHPVQQAVLDLVGDMAGVSLVGRPGGIDGCGIPVVGIPLESLAFAFARFATGVGFGPVRQSAADRIYQAMIREPFMVAGTGRWCTRAMEAGDGAFIVKTGAEGVYCGAIPQAGVGIALKIDDGSSRAAECAMGAILSGLGCLDPEQGLIVSPVLNVAGHEVGEIRPEIHFQDQLMSLIDRELTDRDK